MPMASAGAVFLVLIRAEGRARLLEPPQLEVTTAERSKSKSNNGSFGVQCTATESGQRLRLGMLTAVIHSRLRNAPESALATLRMALVRAILLQRPDSRASEVTGSQFTDGVGLPQAAGSSAATVLVSSPTGGDKNENPVVTSGCRCGLLHRRVRHDVRGTERACQAHAEPRGRGLHCG